MSSAAETKPQPNPDLPPPLARAKPLHFRHLAAPLDASSKNSAHSCFFMA